MALPFRDPRSVLFSLVFVQPSGYQQISRTKVDTQHLATNRALCQLLVDVALRPGAGAGLLRTY